MESHRIRKYNPPMISPSAYSFENIQINTKINDLSIDIHIEPPKTSKGYFSIE